MNITMGCDPELFLFDNLKQRIVPANGKIGGSKRNPMKIDGGMQQLDGTVIEIGIEPARSGEEFVQKVKHVVNQVRTKLDNRYHGRYELRCGAVATYDDEDIDFCRSAFDVGCDPQYQFSGDQLSVIPVPSNVPRNRVITGGHIHVGFGCNMDTTDPVLVQSVKRYVSALGMMMPVGRSEEARVYQLGCRPSSMPVRLKSYGVELRKPSAYWLASERTMLAYFEYLQATASHLAGGDTGRVVTASRELRESRREVNSNSRCVPSKYQYTLPLDV